MEDGIRFSKANIAAFLAHLARFGLVLELLGNRGEEIIPQGGRDAQEEVGVEVAFAHNLGDVRGVGVDLLRQPNMLAALLLQDLRYHPAYMNVVNVHFAKSQKSVKLDRFPLPEVFGATLQYENKSSPRSCVSIQLISFIAFQSPNFQVERKKPNAL